MRLVCPKCGTLITKKSLHVNVDFVLGIPTYSIVFGYKKGEVVEVEEVCDPDTCGIDNVEFICGKCNQSLEFKELYDIYNKVHNKTDGDYVAAIKAVYESLRDQEKPLKGE